MFLTFAALWVWLKLLWRPSMASTFLETRYVNNPPLSLTVHVLTLWSNSDMMKDGIIDRWPSF